MGMRTMVGMGALLIAAACGTSTSGGGGDGGASSSSGTGPGVTSGIPDCPACEVLVADLGYVTGGAVDASGLTLLSEEPSDAGRGPGKLRRIDASGTVTTLAEGIAYGGGVAMSDDAVFYTHAGGLNVLRKGAPSALFAKAPPGSGVAVADGFVYFGAGTETKDGAVVRCPVAGCPSTPESLATGIGAGYPKEMAVRGGRVLFSATLQTSGGVYVIESGSKVARNIAPSYNGDRSDLTSAFAVWVDDKSKVQRCPLPDCNTHEEAPGALATAIAVSENELYYAYAGQVSHVTMGLGPTTKPNTLVPGISRAEAYSPAVRYVFVNDTHVWIVSESQTSSSNGGPFVTKPGVVVRIPR